MKNRTKKILVKNCDYLLISAEEINELYQILFLEDVHDAIVFLHKLKRSKKISLNEMLFKKLI